MGVVEELPRSWFNTFESLLSAETRLKKMRVLLNLLAAATIVVGIQCASHYNRYKDELVAAVKDALATAPRYYKDATAPYYKDATKPYYYKDATRPYYYKDATKPYYYKDATKP